MYMCSGLDDHQTCEVWAQFDYVQWSYTQILWRQNFQHGNLMPHHDHTLWWITFDPYALLNMLIKIQVDRIHSLGVGQSMGCLIFAQISHWIQNGRLPVHCRGWTPDNCLYIWRWYICIPNLMHVGQTVWPCKLFKSENSVVVLLSQFARPMSRTHVRPNFPQGSTCLTIFVRFWIPQAPQNCNCKFRK